MAANLVFSPPPPPRKLISTGCPTSRHPIKETWVAGVSPRGALTASPEQAGSAPAAHGDGDRSHRLNDAPPWFARLRAAGAAGGRRRSRGKCHSSARVNYSERTKEGKETKKKMGRRGPRPRGGPRGVAWSSRMTAPSRKQALVSLTAAPRKHWLRCALLRVSVCFLLKEKPPTSNDNMTTPTARTGGTRPLGPPGWTGRVQSWKPEGYVQKRGGHRPGVPRQCG